VLGSAVGNAIFPGAGGVVGGKLASAAGRMFGLELEGLSYEDQEFEAAKGVIRLAGAAASNAAQVEAEEPPQGARLAPLAKPIPDASRRLNRGSGPAKNSRSVFRSPRCPYLCRRLCRPSRRKSHAVRSLGRIPGRPALHPRLQNATRFAKAANTRAGRRLL